MTTRSRNTFSPKLTRTEDDCYRCEDLDAFFEKRNETIEGIECHIVGPQGYLATTMAPYPLPAELQLEGGQIRIRLAELWVRLKPKDYAILGVYDCSRRAPAVYQLVDH